MCEPGRIEIHLLGLSACVSFMPAMSGMVENGDAERKVLGKLLTGLGVKLHISEWFSLIVLTLRLSFQHQVGI